MSRPHDPPERQNEYFIEKNGIAREVIQADICRYLGNRALVKPGVHQVRIPFFLSLLEMLSIYLSAIADEIEPLVSIFMLTRSYRAVRVTTFVLIAI